MNLMPVENMTLDEVNAKLLKAFRDGRLNIDLKGVVLGFARAMKSPNPNRPSQKQISIARRLITEVRRMDGSEPEFLIDSEDNEAGREQAMNEAEF